jgi:D-glycero-alpha-D-manno-heptose-7-phosphate kinase
VKEMAIKTRKYLENGEVARIGEILHESWIQKKRLASRITNSLIEESYEQALQSGAEGGKITGAGGGGFLLLYCRPERQQAVTRALENRGLKRIAFHFETSGVRILMNAAPRLLPSEMVQHA